MAADLLRGFDSPYPQLKDFYLAIYFAAAFPALRFFLDISIFEKVATWLLNTHEGSSQKILKDGDMTRKTKMKESLWKLVCYLALELFVYQISCDNPWFYDTDAFFNGWPNQILKLQLKLYYTCQCGFYIYSGVALLVWETRRKDFSVMVSHHIITLTLIVYSYITRFFRIGSVVLALHDASDLIMELAKLCKYSGKELSASVCFALFAVSWFLLRLIYFPFWVIRSSTYNSVKYMDLSNWYATWMYYTFNTMLITLLVFHIYWWMLICRMVHRQLQNKGKVDKDIRSDSEDEDD